MTTKEFLFSDGDKLYVSYEGTAGRTDVSLSADPNLSGVERTFDLTFHTDDGGAELTLRVVQGAKGEPLRITTAGAMRTDTDGGVRIAKQS